MPTAVESPATFTPPQHKRWTRAECERLVSTGILHPDRYELVAGELVLKVSKGYRHMLVLIELIAWLHAVFGPKCVLQEGTIDLHPEDQPASAPEPDATVLRRPMRELGAPPGPRDILFVAEISNTTLPFDLTVKAGLYARAGIQEYWVLDVESRKVIVHRRPEAGRYSDVAAYGATETLATLAAPERAIGVGELFQ